MTVDVYATRRDLYKYGLPRGTLSLQGQELASVSSSTDVLELDEHGFETNDEVLVRAAEGGTLAAPLVAATPYYAIRITAATFKLAAATAGPPIDLTTNGVSMFVSTALPYDETLELYSRFVDGVIPHLVPLSSPYPIIVVATVAKLSGKELQRLAGVSSIAMAEAEKEARDQLVAWGKGQPIRDTKATASSNLTIVGKKTSASDLRGWGSDRLP